MRGLSVYIRLSSFRYACMFVTIANFWDVLGETK